MYGYGERLRQGRKAKNMSLVQVAMALNTTHATISRYENEKLEPNIGMMTELCKLYDLSSDYILGLPEDLKYPKK